MFSEARSILWQAQGWFSLLESSKNLFQDRCEFFGVGFHRSCGGEFFPSFLESLRTIAAHSGLLPAEREGIVPLSCSSFTAHKHRSYLRRKIARQDQCL